MKVALQLEFADEQAATVLQWLQSIPSGLVAKFQSRQQLALVETVLPGEEPSEAEQRRLLHELFGAWKDGVSGEEMVREIYEARDSGHREVEV